MAFANESLGLQLDAYVMVADKAIDQTGNSKKYPESFFVVCADEISPASYASAVVKILRSR